MVAADPRIVDTAGQVAFARGPLVYCLEQEDVAFPVERARVSVDIREMVSQVHVQWHPDLLGGVHLLRVPGVIAPRDEQNNPYFEARPGEATKLALIPFYARANRSDDNRWVTFLPLALRP